MTDKKYIGIYSYFYTGDSHAFYVKVGFSKDIRRRLKQHKSSNPLIEVGPTIKTQLGFTDESLMHKIFKELYEQVAPEHYKLTVNQRINFEDNFNSLPDIFKKRRKKIMNPLR